MIPSESEPPYIVNMDQLNSPARNVYIETFGCQMNDLDSERLLEFLSESGYRATTEVSEADLILLNTCSVRDKAEQKVYSAAGRFKALKEENPDIIIGISGCVAQQKGDALLKRMPYLDLVLGPSNIHRIGEFVAEISKLRNVISETSMSEGLASGEYRQRASSQSIKTFVSIMRGCDNYCSYCIVPYTRGSEVSRAETDILDEIEGLAAAGVKEVTLLGQNVNSYGIKDVSPGDKRPFVKLIEKVAAFEGIERIRFVTSHPKDISGELIDLFGTQPKLARHIHLPLQSGSDRMLKMMRRRYDREEYLSKVTRLKTFYPDMALTTDIIVGFPGETEADFAETMEILEEVSFDNIFSFKYSPREGTAAFDLPGQVSSEVMSNRLAELQARQRSITTKKNNALVGREIEILVEGPSKLNKDELTGRTPCNRVLNFEGPEDITGTLASVLVTESYSNSFRGRYIERNLLCS